tara:strand:+ start:182 stop:439 length:258 start_codon:yes stop_codon:yes gene_type:complete
MIQDTKECNGYTNFATWDFQVITNNDYGLYHQVRDIVISNINDKEKVVQSLKAICGYIDDIDSYEVDYKQVADTWISDIKEELYG